MNKNMTDKEFNSVDGDSTFQKVTKEINAKRIEKNRRDYKDAMRTQIIRHEQAKEAASKAQATADRVSGRLDKLIEGGMEGYLASEECQEMTHQDIANSFSIKRITRKPIARQTL
jgi:hypothetical protein